MRLTLRLSPSLTSAGDPRFRFRFLLFDVRICRRCDRPRLIFPVPVTLKRLAAPLCVFNFGIESSRTAVSSQLSVSLHSRKSQMTAQKRPATPSAARNLLFFLRCGFGNLRRRRPGRTLRRSLVLLFPVLLFLPLLLRLLRRQYRMKSISFLAGGEFYDAVGFDVFDQALQDLAAEAGSGHFASAEEDGRLYF